MNHRHRATLVALTAAVLVACGTDVAEETSRGRTAQALGVQMLTTCSAGHEQDSAAISGSRVVFTDDVSSGPNVLMLDVAAGGPPVALTSAAQGWSVLPDIAGDVVAFTRVVPGLSLGDIVAIDLRRQVEWTPAAAASTIWFELPALGGNILTFMRRTSLTTDIEVYDLTIGGAPPPRITDDEPIQARPRTDGGWIVYEDYRVPTTPSIKAFSIATGWPAIAVTDGTFPASMPDVDGGVVVYVAHVGGSDQIFLFDTVTRTSTQLTTTPSVKSQPRISAGHVVWVDDRNGTRDILGYDIATRTEVSLVTGAGDQYSPDIAGDRIVFTTNETGCVQIGMVTFPVVMPPPTVASTLDDIRDGLASGDIANQGIANALSSQLASAAATRAAGDCAAAAAILRAFIATVSAQSGKGISTTTAASLIADAQYLIDHCP